MYKYSHLFTLVILSLVLNQPSYSQSSINTDIFKVYLHNDFEENTTGIYRDDEWLTDWNYPEWSNRQVPPEIVEGANMLPSGRKFMRWHLPLGSVGPEEGGGQWLTKIGDNLNEVYLSYNLRFKPGFEWVLSGKIPGLRGGPIWSGSGPPEYDDGFVSLLMWNRTGYVKFYYYHHDQTHDYGDNVLWDYPIETGVWYNVTTRIVINTIGSNGGNNDGIMEGYVNGKLVSQVTGLKLRNVSDISIDQIFMACAFGGTGDEFAAIRDEWIDVDDFVAYTYQNGINVPRGNTPNVTGNDLLLPNYESENSTWKQNVNATAISPHKIRITWSNYSTSTSYILERNVQGTSEFVTVAQLGYGTNSYTDENLTPSTTYYYRIKAGSEYSNECYATTNNLVLPSAPTSLRSLNLSSTSVTLTWIDNSVIESGYLIERTAPDKTVEVFTVGANITSWSNTGLLENAVYSYRVRAYNQDGYSPYSNTIVITTPYVPPPLAPTSLRTTDYSEKSISIAWNDNSADEDGFIITRSLAANPSNTTAIKVDANQTSLTDSDLPANTSYIYSVRAINSGGNSASSNKNVASTLSVAETKRVKEGLIAYYNFVYNPDYIVYDISNYQEPLNLKIKNPASVTWNDRNRLEVLSNTSLVSAIPANKIVTAINKTGEISMECWIKPFEPDPVADSRVISLSLNDSNIGFALDQNYSSTNNEKSLNYSIRVQTESTNQSGYPKLIQANEIPNLNLQHLVYTRDTTGNEKLYINGKKTNEGFRPSNFSSWSNNFYLRLGNESDLVHPWKGIYYTVAVFNRALSENEILKNYSVGPCDSLINGNFDFTINIFPNPVSDVTHIEITPLTISDFFPETTIRILDVFGKMVYQEKLFNPESLTKTLDLSYLSEGMYFLEVLYGSDRKSAKFVVK